VYRQLDSEKNWSSRNVSLLSVRPTAEKWSRQPKRHDSKTQRLGDDRDNPGRVKVARVPFLAGWRGGEIKGGKGAWIARELENLELLADKRFETALQSEIQSSLVAGKWVFADWSYCLRGDFRVQFDRNCSVRESVRLTASEKRLICGL
jgi:hypothetical protein